MMKSFFLSAPSFGPQRHRNLFKKRLFGPQVKSWAALQMDIGSFSGLTWRMIFFHRITQLKPVNALWSLAVQLLVKKMSLLYFLCYNQLLHFVVCLVETYFLFSHISFLFFSLKSLFPIPQQFYSFAILK